MYEINYSKFTTDIMKHFLKNMGIVLFTSGGFWYVNKNPEIAQHVIDSFNLEELKRECDSHITSLANNLRESLVKNVSYVEMSSWPVKLSEAIKCMESGTLSESSIVYIEASIRNIPVADLCSKIINNAGMLQYAESAIAGKRGFIIDQIWSCTNIQQLESLGILDMVDLGLNISVDY